MSLLECSFTSIFQLIISEHVTLYGIMNNQHGAGVDPDDYELWSPHDTNGDRNCLLGEQTFYKRRKREAACFNPNDYETKTQVQSFLIFNSK
jgi:hypothetical protein